MKIEIKRLRPDAPIPEYATAMAGALDLHACITERLILMPGKPAELIATGIALNIDSAQVAALIMPRSGLGHKFGLVLGNTVGLIDGDYQGQVFISAWNRGPDPIVIDPMDRIAQMVFLPLVRAEFAVVREFSASSIRGAGGFGSTGV